MDSLSAGEVVGVKFLDRLFPSFGGDDGEDCDRFDHNYGPWTDFRLETCRNVGEDAIRFVVGYTLTRTCRDCGDTDRMWRPHRAEIKLDIEWWHGEERGSSHHHGKPIFEGGEVELSRETSQQTNDD